MTKGKINIKDYEKILQFVTEVQNIKTNFRSTILTNLSNFFGYNHLTFFLADKGGRFINPVATNISSYLTKIYVNYYYSTDIFHTVKKTNSTFGKNVISITDIMPYSQFENTEYYRDFLKLDNLYYEIAIPLRIGNNLLGGIGIFNPKDSGNFTLKDIMILEKLSEVISSALNNYIKLNEMSYEQELFKSMTSQCPIGLVVLKNNNSIVYFNNTAKEFCLDILKDKKRLNPIETIIDKLFLEGEFEKNNSYGYICKSIENYKFKIVSSIVPNAFERLNTLIYIYITKKDINHNKDFCELMSSYNFTNREMQVIELVLKGFSNKEISENLFISYHTVKAHMDNIFKKTKVNSRISLIYKINNIT